MTVTGSLSDAKEPIAEFGDAFDFGAQTMALDEQEEQQEPPPQPDEELREEENGGDGSGTFDDPFSTEGWAQKWGSISAINGPRVSYTQDWDTITHNSSGELVYEIDITIDQSDMGWPDTEFSVWVEVALW